MSFHRRPSFERRVPPGAAIMIALAGSLIFWAALAIWLAVRALGPIPDISISPEEASHADQ